MSQHLCSHRPRRYHLRILGPSMSGKTTFLRYLQHGQFVETVPTNEMEVSRVVIRGASCLVWDSRKFGVTDMNPATLLMQNILEDLQTKSALAAQHSMDAIIYVVDASDPGRLNIASRDFERAMKTYHRVPVVLILGTKTDKSSSDIVLSKEQIKAELRLPETAYDRECLVALTSAITGEGIDEATEWLYSKIWERQGCWASFIQQFRVNNGRLKLPDVIKWDPFTCCRYSRLAR